MNSIKTAFKLLAKHVPRCLVCRNAVTSAGYPLCENCSSFYSKLISTDCKECGKPVRDCNCVEVTPCLKFYRLFEYEGDTAKDIIYRLKRAASPVDFIFISRRLKERIQYTSGNINFDCVCYVPRNKKGIAKYGYDHAKLLGDALAKRFGIPCIALLAHTGAKGEQKRLSRMYRGFAAKTRFEVNSSALQNGKLPYKRILLADDIVTTGNTMGECARILKTCGARQVFGVAIGHTPSRDKNRRKSEDGRSF
ncbi:MAG: ComF family protein [Ruminococcaceae bacterium]|nr:ComF family protein [Oscillospiraceae bacterium]